MAVNNTANIVKAKKAIAKAFRYQKEGKGFGMVEVPVSYTHLPGAAPPGLRDLLQAAGPV